MIVIDDRSDGPARAQEITREIMDEYEGDTVAVVLSACLAVAEACAAGAGLTKQQLCDILMRKGAKNAVV